MLEALHVRPELGAFEAALRDRIERLAAFEDERFARIRGVDRDPDTGELVVFSEFVPGTRLCDLLDVAQERAQEGITPGVDVALGYLIEALPAISSLHAAAGVTHGAIAPARTVLTPDGQVVFLDAPFGEILERLHFSPRRLWTEFGLAMPPSAGICRFDVPGDIAQVALNAVMLVLGRPLREHEYPDALLALMMEVVEVAQIRGTPDFAGGIQQFLQRALPLPGRRWYGSADEATVDVTQVARQQIGLPVCRSALIDFVTQAAEGLASPQVKLAPLTTAAEEPFAAAVMGVLFEQEETAVEQDEIPIEQQEAPLEPEVRLEPEVPFDSEVRLGSAEIDDSAPAPEISVAAEDQVEAFAKALARTLDAHAPPRTGATPEPAAEPCVAERPVAEDAVAERVTTEEAMEAEVGEAVAFESFVSEPFAPEPEVPETAVDAPEPVIDFRRRKRRRSEPPVKDKLRSVASDAQAGSAGQRLEPLVSPDRAAAYNNDDFSPLPRTIGFGPPPLSPAAAPPQPAFAPAALAPPSAPARMPQFPAAPPASPYGGPATTIWSAPPVPPDTPAPPPQPVAPAPKAVTAAQSGPPAHSVSPSIKLKGHTPSPAWAAKAAHAEPRVDRSVVEPYAALPEIGQPAQEQPRAFPWKLAAGAIIIVAAGVAAGRYYLAGGQTGARNDAPVTTSAPAAPRKTTSGSPPADAARIEIQTQPPGAHVLLDGKTAGQTPLTLDVTPGRHVLTFMSASGSVKRNVRVDAGKSISLDVPLFSGWVAIFAPIVLDVSENGRSIGSTEDGRLMLAPGRHALTLTNKELGYVEKRAIDIEPGEVNTLNLEPSGSVNFNAIPWAEVWIDGKKAGDTPVANAQVPLGIREIVFRNPDYGERRVVTTVRGDAVGALTVDFTSK